MFFALVYFVRFCGFAAAEKMPGRSFLRRILFRLHRFESLPVSWGGLRTTDSVDFVDSVTRPNRNPRRCGATWRRERQTLSTLAAFLAVEESALEAMLTQRTVVTRGETFTKQLGLDDANLTRDAIVKSLYEVFYVHTNNESPWFGGVYVRSFRGETSR